MNTNESNEPFLAARAEWVGGDECEANVWKARCQATLWFSGRVFVFENVPCEKVNFAVLVLGGYELNGSSTTGVAPHRITSNDPMRRECLNRYYQKKKRRCYHKKIRYSVRRDIALKIHREGGQFAGKNVMERSRSLRMMGESETTCGNCGVSSKDTPMMRKGPNGPNTLCNACGLAWTRTK